MTKRRSRGLFAFVGCALVLVAAAWLAGLATAALRAPSPVAAPPGIVPPGNFQLFRDVWHIVDKEYYGDAPTQSAITHGAIGGLVAALDDPYAAFVAGDDAASGLALFEPRLVGGLGTWIEATPLGALVLSVVRGTPAERAGLLPGDLVLAAGDQALAGLGRDEMLDLLRGPSGTTVVLALRRGEAAPFAAEVTREDFEQPGVALDRPVPEVAYLRIASLAPAVVAELDAALTSLRADPPEAIVLDLRDNPGSDVATLQRVAARFLDGIVYREVARDGTETMRTTDESDAPRLVLPERMVVLVNSGTASTAEMLAGALRDRRGAQLLGTTTYGKGSIQVFEPLSDGSRLRYTAAEWLTPDGQRVNDAGIVPDQTIEVTDADREAGRDPQLEAALAAARPAAAASGG